MLRGTGEQTIDNADSYATFCRDVLSGLDTALRTVAESALDRALAKLERE